MAIPLSHRTAILADMLFEEPLRSLVKQALVDRVSENIPCWQPMTPESIERVRFAVMKLVRENELDFEKALAEAQFDWRDLFMAAGFGYNADEHEVWFLQVLANAKNCN
jgi:hypothetical protein